MKVDLVEKTIKKHLFNDVKLIVYDELVSSNITAKELAKNGENEFTTVVALKQTNGRGRLGRSFISNSENGLYMSIILRPEMEANKCVDVTALAAVAVSDAIESTSQKETQIKWINDIYIEEKKVSGILTEASFSGDGKSLDYVICGIGVNILPPQNGFDDEIKNIAGAIFENEAPSEYKEKLCANIIDSFITYYKKLPQKAYMEKYKSKSSIIGKNVNVYRGSEVISGVALDINDNAELVVKKENGTMCVFNSGEARVRRCGEKLSN